jgi:hypothetical protein
MFSNRRSPSPADQYDGYGNNSSSVNYNENNIIMCPNSKLTCSVDDCSAEAIYGNYCFEHYTFCIVADCQKRVSFVQAAVYEKNLC